MLQRRTYSKNGDGDATKKNIFKKGGLKCYEEDDIKKRGTEMLQRRIYSKKGDGNATKKKIFKKGGRKCYIE